MLRSFGALLLAAVVAAQAQPVDPLNSTECERARRQLESALDDQAASKQARALRLAEARKQARVACLGPSSGNAVRSGAPQPVQTVPPPVTSMAPATTPVPAAAPPLPPLAIPRAVTIGNCDPAGCWDSEGRRMNNMGPLLMGPSGLCSIQGGAVVCP